MTHTSPPNTERDAFEAHQSRSGWSESDLSEKVSDDSFHSGEYINTRLQDDWELWQAARAVPAPQVQESDELDHCGRYKCKVCDDQRKCVTPPALPQVQESDRQRIQKAKDDAMAVFKDSCNHTHDAIEYMTMHLRASLIAPPALAANQEGDDTPLSEREIAVLADLPLSTLHALAAGRGTPASEEPVNKLHWIRDYRQRTGCGLPTAMREFEIRHPAATDTPQPADQPCDQTATKWVQEWMGEHDAVLPTTAYEALIAKIAQPAEQTELSDEQDGLEDLAEGLEILIQLYDNIEKDGNYSKESTLGFLDGIRGLLQSGLAAAKGKP